MQQPRPRLTFLSVVVMELALAGCVAGVRSIPSEADAGGMGTAGSAGGGGTGGVGPVNSGAGGRIACDGAASCKLPIPEGCGDGINNQGGIEVCDDGNTLAGDGCNGACQVEPNWTCPPAGPCTRSFVCGDGAINPGEVCDDGNSADGDGCNATCTIQDPGYTCTPGRLCVSNAVCGNKRIEPGETCDDGNTLANDGCGRTCILEAGWVCPVPGSPCKRPARCGDGVVNVSLGEVCDDGNTADGDGCSADCTIKGAGCACVPGQLCTCPVVRCGNGTIEGNEQCDDNNAASNDGCSSTCQVERGYICPLTRAPCIPNCGDGIVIGNEQCDPGVNVPNMNLACSSTCRWNPGWACTGNPPTECHATVCGDGKKEGSESCDDGNSMPFDGCSSDCQNEPSCPNIGPCTPKCGDGVLLGEACEDGNNIDGDGCSSTCMPEAGYTCTRPALGDRILVPIVYRDFLQAHIDFEPGVMGKTTATTGLVGALLDAQDKPTFAGVAGGPAGISTAATFAQWYRDVTGVNHTTASKLTLWSNGLGAFVNRFGANGEQWALTAQAFFCGNVGSELLDPVTNAPIPCTFRFGPTECDTHRAAGEILLSCFIPANNPTAWNAIFQTGVLDGNPLFFPVDGDPFTPVAERSAATVPPPYSGPGNNFPAEAGTPPPLHNFHFTSEVHYWFPFDATQTYLLDFLGDDDVWVFVNKHLAVDLGGIHTPVGGTITISAANAGTFGMMNGNVYEIEVFQAERQKTSSSYKLTLSGFNGALSQCIPICGNGIVTAGEQCDNGTQNGPGYNQCTTACRLGPYCGDGHVDAPNEDCDNGINNDAYGSGTGCGPGCKLPARCGDGVVQAAYGETCDDGINDGRYAGCTPDCQRAGTCGDGQTQSPQESCDDGANDGTYGTCGDPSQPLPNCGPAPRCGDGVLDDAYGEQCEPTSANDPNCTAVCRRPGVCGDAVTTPPEQCDYGTSGNDGSYGGCSPGCVRAPYCGDGIKNGPEECDDGILDNSYGGCSPQCKLAPHCGDGVVQVGYEQCDLGAANGPDSLCTTTCQMLIP
jgi:fibro-slime domain-containing protein